MPTYEYRCPKGHEFELVQPMSAKPRTKCPECGKIAERLLSVGAGLIFKGEGFYITDHRSEAYKKAASSDKEAASAEKKEASGDSGKKTSAGDASSAGSGSDGGPPDGGSSKSKGALGDASKASGGSKSSRSGKPSQSES